MNKIKNSTLYGVFLNHDVRNKETCLCAGDPKKHETMRQTITNAELIDDLMKRGYRFVPVGGNFTEPCTIKTVKIPK